MPTITESIATEVAEAVAEAFKPWSYDLVWKDGELLEDENGDLVLEKSKYGPKVVKDYSDFGGYAIVWEECSPYGWVHNTTGGVDEEFGGSIPAVVLPGSVEYLEPIDSIAVLIVPKEGH